MQLEGLVIPVSFQLGGLLKGVEIITDLIGGAVGQTFEWADSIDKLGDVTGMTAEQTAAWAFIAKKAGVEVNTLANSSVILAKGLFDSEGQLSTTGKALENFGISITDVDGKVKDQSTLMNDIAEKYSTFGTATEKVDFLTNIFGKSGAQLVDVFDTLAQEGGIDSVEQKIKDLGLSIDPEKYEQFTRNLEELKLAGTGLAVQFVDQLMPVFEQTLKWAQQFQGMTPEQIFQRITDVVSELPSKFETWAQNVNWQQVSQNLIDGINSIDWAGLGNWVGQSAQKITNGLITIFKEVNWGDLFKAIGTAFMNFSTGLVGGNFAKFKSVWQSNWNQAKDIVTKAMQLAQNAVLNWLRGLPQAINAYFSQALENLKEWVARLLEALAPLAAALAGATTGAAGSTFSIPGAASGGNAGGLTWVGENGPELVNLPSGSYVNHNQQSNRMANQPVQAYIDYDELARTLARVLGQQMQRA